MNFFALFLIFKNLDYCGFVSCGGVGEGEMSFNFTPKANTSVAIPHSGPALNLTFFISNTGILMVSTYFCLFISLIIAGLKKVIL